MTHRELTSTTCLHLRTLKAMLRSTRFPRCSGTYCSIFEWFSVNSTVRMVWGRDGVSAYCLAAVIARSLTMNKYAHRRQLILSQFVSRQAPIHLNSVPTTSQQPTEHIHLPKNTCLSSQNVPAGVGWIFTLTTTLASFRAKNTNPSGVF